MKSLINGKFSEVQQKATNMDEGLKTEALDLLREALHFSISGDVIRCYRSYYGMFSLINHYDFEGKEEVIEITEIIDNYIKTLGGKPFNKAHQVKIRQNQYEMRELVQKYSIMIPAAYSELGLWFKTINYHHDTDKHISNIFFNDDLTTITKRKKELLKLSTKELISFMRPSNIHLTFCKYMALNEAGEEKDV